MKFVVIENTDALISRISFGTASLHHIVSARQRQRLLAAVADYGITHFDTSPYYGDGLAEVDLGAFMSHGRANRTITTKFGLYPRGRAAHSVWHLWVRRAVGRLNPDVSRPVIDWDLERARASLRESLKRLRTDYVDFLFLHEPDLSAVAVDETRRWLEVEQKNGTIRYWGLAGRPSLIEPWLDANSPLAAVVQTRDDLVERSADFLLQYDRRLQFTYGYLASSLARGDELSPTDVMRGALRRNSHGSIVVSTRRPERLAALASLVQ